MTLFEGLEKFGDQISLLETDREPVTYKQLVEISDEIASRINRRSLVFCLTSNISENVIGYVGLQRAGHVCLMLASKIDDIKLDDLVRRFEPNFIWAPNSDELNAHYESFFSYGRYSLYSVSLRNHDLNPELSLLMGTSGSTGSPMMVRQSSKNLKSNAASIIQSLELDHRDRAITTLPMNYTYGLSIINSQLLVGGSLVMSDATLMERAFWDQINSCEPTYFGGVPYTYEMLNRIGIKKLNGTSIRMLTQAGGKLKSELVAKISSECTSLNIKFYVMYGQTEATARMSVLPWNEVHKHPESIGRPIPGGSFRIVDIESGVEVPSGSVGELVYAGPNVALGYANSWSDLARDDDFKQILQTGDLAKTDADELVYIVGRKKRFIKIFGNRINLDDIDNFLSAKNLETVSTGRDDHLIVNVVSEDESIPVVDEVARFLGIHKSAISVNRIRQIPRNESGKVLFSELEQSSEQ